MSARPPSWSSDRLDTLRTMWGNLASLDDIAEALSTTRGAVSGQIHRLGLARNRRKRADAAGRTVSVPVRHAARVPDVLVMATRERSPVLELGPDTCRWPEGDPRSPDFRFCCAPTARSGGPYCGAHMLRAYEPRGTRFKAPDWI